jgi:hypothetical protein
MVALIVFKQWYTYCYALYAIRRFTGAPEGKTKKTTARARGAGKTGKASDRHDDDDDVDGAAAQDESPAVTSIPIEEHTHRMTVHQDTQTKCNRTDRVRAFCLLVLIHAVGPLISSSATAQLHMRTPRDLRRPHSWTFASSLHRGIDALLLVCVFASLIWVNPVEVGRDLNSITYSGGIENLVRAIASIAFYRLYGAEQEAQLVRYMQNPQTNKEWSAITNPQPPPRTNIL